MITPRQWQNLTERERRDTILAKRCRVCKAGNGERCTLAGNGVPIKPFHYERVLDARKGEPVYERSEKR